MDIKSEFEEIKRREAIEYIKTKLASMGKIEAINLEANQEIEELRGKMAGLASGLNQTESVQTSFVSKEDKSLMILDKILTIEKDLADINKDYEVYEDAINSLEDATEIRLVYEVRVYKKETIRSLAPKLKLSRNKLWRLSDAVLYKLLRFSKSGTKPSDFMI